MKKKHPHLVKFGSHLRKLRVELGYSSQEALADACDLDRTYISGIERGERNVSLINLIVIAKTLGVDVGELVPPNKKLTDKVN